MDGFCSTATAAALGFASSSPSKPFSFSCDPCRGRLLSPASLVTCVFVVSSEGMLFLLARIPLDTYWPGLLDGSAICFPLSAKASEMTPCATEIDSRAVSVRGEAFSRHEPPYQLLLLDAFADVSLDCDPLLVVGELVSAAVGDCAVSSCTVPFCVSGSDWLASVGSAAGAWAFCRDFLRAGAMGAKMSRRTSRLRWVESVCSMCLHVQCTATGSPIPLPSRVEACLCLVPARQRHTEISSQPAGLASRLPHVQRALKRGANCEGCASRVKFARPRVWSGISQRSSSTPSFAVPPHIPLATSSVPSAWLSTRRYAMLSCYAEQKTY